MLTCSLHWLGRAQGSKCNSGSASDWAYIIHRLWQHQQRHGSGQTSLSVSSDAGAVASEDVMTTNKYNGYNAKILQIHSPYPPAQFVVVRY